MDDIMSDKLTKLTMTKLTILHNMLQYAQYATISYH